MIIDASVAFKWIANEPDTDRAIALIRTESFAAPHLILSEVGNAVRKQIKAGQLVLNDRVARDLTRLPRLIALVDGREDVRSALDLAAQLDHSIYDCVYLAMALRLDQILVTADTKFLGKVAGSRYADRARAL